MPAGAMREGRQSAHVSMAGQEQGSRRATARREERGTEGGARINRNQEKWKALNGTLTELSERLCSILPPSQEVLGGSRLVYLTAGSL